MITKILRKLRKITVRLWEIPQILWLNILIRRARKTKRPVILMELTTSHDIFCIYGVLQSLYKMNALVIYSGKDNARRIADEQIPKEFHPGEYYWINVVWTNWLAQIDFYLNTILSYDINVPETARYKINFPHTITSKTKYDVFSPAIEKISDTVITGPAYERDFLTYCQDHNIKKLPTFHRLGGPKSDNLFTRKINKKEFLRKIGLNPEIPTVFYGPTYNQDASIFTWLEDIMKIPQKNNVNLIIKVHPGAYLDPTNKKSSGGIDWEKFFSAENLRKNHIYNVIDQDSAEYVMASDITITDISTIWIESYFLRKKMIFLDIPAFFKTHQMNSLGDFREKYGYLVKDVTELHKTIAGMISETIPRKEKYDIDDLLLYNKGHATEATVNKIKELYEKR